MIADRSSTVPLTLLAKLVQRDQFRSKLPWEVDWLDWDFDSDHSQPTDFNFSLFVLCIFLCSAARSFSYVHGHHYLFLWFLPFFRLLPFIPRSAHNPFSHLWHSACSALPSYPWGNSSWRALWNLGNLWPCGELDVWKGVRTTAGMLCAVSNVICSTLFGCDVSVFTCISEKKQLI